MVRAAIGRVQPHRTLRLLGAADANGDGRIDYLELAAFVATATGDVVNPNMRPHVFARGPGGHDEIAIVDTLGRSGARMLRMADNTASRKTMTTTGAAVLGLGTLSIAVGVFALARPWAGERLAIDYRATLGQGGDSARAFALADDKIHDLADGEARNKWFQGFAGGVVALSAAAWIASADLDHQTREKRLGTRVTGGLGIVLGLGAIATALLIESPIERLTTIWQRDPGHFHLEPTLAAAPGGGMVGVSGRF